MIEKCIEREVRCKKRYITLFDSRFITLKKKKKILLIKILVIN